VNRALKAGLVMLVPGLFLAWLVKTAMETRDPYEEDFRRYSMHNFGRMKAEEQRWLQ
jgi:hypothetical protein